jgi:acyl-CoA thioesterase
MRFTELIDGLRAGEDGAYRQAIPPEWGQGRTAYGGITAALSGAAAAKAHPGLPPMRSAQVGFIGPAAGEAQVKTELLRQGRSTTFVATDLTAEAGLATRCLFVFGAGRDGALSHRDMPMPDLPPPDPAEVLPMGPPFPNFLSQFEVHIVRGGVPFTGRGDHRSFWWVRHRDENAREGLLPLLALADVTPPAISPKIDNIVPVSSVTWQVDFLTDDPSSADGWYLVETSAESAGDGWSAQRMAIWAKDGRPVAAHRQSVVVFG